MKRRSTEEVRTSLMIWTCYFRKKETPNEQDPRSPPKSIEFYIRSLDEGRKNPVSGRTLQKRKTVCRARHIRGAADIPGSPAREKKHLLLRIPAQHFGKNKVTARTQKTFSTVFLGKIAASKHLMPIHEQTSLLTQGRKNREAYRKWDYLPEDKAILGQELQAAGQAQKGVPLYERLLETRRKSGRPTHAQNSYPADERISPLERQVCRSRAPL